MEALDLLLPPRVQPRPCFCSAGSDVGVTGALSYPSSPLQQPKAGQLPPPCPTGWTLLNSSPTLLSSLIRWVTGWLQAQDSHSAGPSPLNSLGSLAGSNRQQDGELRAAVTVWGGKRKTTLFTEKASPLSPASGLPEGTEVFCWENRKRGFPGPTRPLAGRPPWLPPILEASASCQLTVCLSSFVHPSDHGA